jgi:hypothetical protein
MPLSRRYSPEFCPGESCLIGMDFSAVIPPGVGIARGKLDVFTLVDGNPTDSTDFKVGQVTIRGRVLYAPISGGVDGTDYQLRWSATDTAGNVFPRTALLLCAQTS